MADCEDIIDLTDSFCLSDHRLLADVIIELDDSLTGSLIIDSNQQDIIDHIGKRIMQTHKWSLDASQKSKKKTDQSRKPITEARKRSDSTGHSPWGDCPICWDPLGKNPLASTKCGHVYCMKCLERSLKCERKCPTCRHELKGKSAYHPLYLN